MKNRTLIALGAVVVLALLAYFFVMPQMATAPEETEEQVPETQTETGTGAPVSAYTVRLTDAGFSPASLTVPVGATVTFVNEGTEEMWLAGDEHPTHTGYDGTSKDEHCDEGVSSSFDQCGVSTTYSFTFNKAGTWGYHNHRDSDIKGTIIVE